MIKIDIQSANYGVEYGIVDNVIITQQAGSKNRDCVCNLKHYGLIPIIIFKTCATILRFKKRNKKTCGTIKKVTANVRVKASRLFGITSKIFTSCFKIKTRVCNASNGNVL